jgi:hypothetical protein
MTTAAPTYTPPAPRRFNTRILAFVLIFGLLLGLPLYVFIDTALSGGVKKRGDGVFEVNLQAMSNFVFDQTNGTLDDVPPKWRELDGKRIITEGEIAPGTLQSRGLDQEFELVFSVAKCCFSGPPQIQHFVQVDVPQKNLESVKWDGASRVRLEGVLKVNITRDPTTNAITGVYHITADKLDSL